MMLLHWLVEALFVSKETTLYVWSWPKSTVSSYYNHKTSTKCSVIGKKKKEKFNKPKKMRIKLEDNRTPEMWARRPRWRRRRLPTPPENPYTAPIEPVPNDVYQSILIADGPDLNDDSSSVLNKLPNNSSCDLLTSYFLKNTTENATEVISEEKRLDVIFLRENCQSMSTSSLMDIKSLQPNDNDDDDLIANTERFIWQTALDNTNNKVDISVVKDKDTSFIRILCRECSKTPVLKSPSVSSLTEELTIHVKTVHSSTSKTVVNIYSSNVNKNSSKRREILVYIEDKLPLIPTFRRRYINASTSTRDVACICSCKKSPTPRYILPACVVKGVVEPRNEHDPWIRVMEKLKVKRSLLNDLNSNKSSLAMTKNDTSVSSSSSSSTSLDEFTLCPNVKEESRWSVSACTLSIPPLKPQETVCCKKRHRRL